MVKRPVTQDLARAVHALAIAALVCTCACSSPETADVTVRVIDASTGRTTPAMVAIFSLDDDSLRLPPDGRRYEGKGSVVSDFHRGIDFDPDPNWIGPVRRMQGMGNNRDRSFMYGPKDSLPYWKEIFSHSTTGKFSIRLEPGRYRLSAARGNEYVPIRQEFEVSAERTPVEQTVALERWTNQAAKGWYSGDVHVHHPTTKPEFREFLLHYAVAEDVHLVNVLTMGRPNEVLMPQDLFGRPQCDETKQYCLISGQEDPRSFFGHMTGSRISEPARFPDDYDLYDVTLNGIRQQGGLVGIAHFAFNGGGGPGHARQYRRYWYLTRGLVDFVELLQYRWLNTSDFYDYLDIGIPMTAAAGSDLPWGSTLGEARTYVHLEGEFDVNAWFAGLEAGRTFISNGPILEFRADGQLAGSEIHVEAGHPARIELSVTGHKGVGLPRHLRLIGSDGLLGEFLPDAAEPARIAVTTTLNIERSQWIVVSTECYNGAVAHSSPIYFVVGDEPFIHPDKAPAIIDRHLDSLDELRNLINGWRDHPHRGAILAQIEEAADFYRGQKQQIAASTRD
ncbi:MAG: CehA/McbA family metallohydrolase [Myxococcota bacterium]